ncbi:MAG: peptide chain release factor N(5)-glutamine methyltransferase [Anaerolineae bacterium]
MSPFEHASQPAAAPPRAAAFFLAEGATVAEALQQAAGALSETDPSSGLRTGLDTPRLDAEVLLAHVLDISRAALLARLTDPLPAGARATFENLITRRLHHEPVAYLTSHQEFYELDFYVDQRVLIPRPETELLVDRAIAIRNSKFEIRNSKLNIVDVGTGSGCIAVALAVHLPQAEIYATDVSPEAMEVAQINVERHRVVDRVHLIQSDLLRDMDPRIRFDIVVANLPYVSDSELAQLPAPVRDYEPVEWALQAGPDGLDLIRRLLDQAQAQLQRGGVVLLEIGAKQGAATSELARRRFPEADVRVWKDLAGLDRVVEIQTKGEL